MSELPKGVTAAEAALERAQADVLREQVLEDLRSRPGLAYASTGAEELGPFLVALDGEVVGEVRSEQQTVVQGWYAVLYDGDRECEPAGPFPTIRAAAASMIRS